jgi:hypothetical protein
MEFHMLPIILLPLALSTADAKKSKSPENEASDAAAVPVEQQADVPGDAASKKFSKTLMSANGFNNFIPDVEGLVYKTIRFLPDNTWSADAAIEVMDESMECTESGTWKMDPAKSPKTAGMEWDIQSTDCPSLESGRNLRILATLNGNAIDAEYR